MRWFQRGVIVPLVGTSAASWSAGDTAFRPQLRRCIGLAYGLMVSSSSSAPPQCNGAPTTNFPPSKNSCHRHTTLIVKHCNSCLMRETILLRRGPAVPPIRSSRGRSVQQHGLGGVAGVGAIGGGGGGWWPGTRKHVCLSACLYYVCVYVCMYVCMYVCTYVCMYACTSVCLHVCMSV